MKLLQVEPSFFWTIWPLGSSNPDHSLSLCMHCPCCQTRVTRGVQQLRVCLADNLTFMTSSFGFLTSVAFDLDPGNPLPPSAQAWAHEPQSTDQWWSPAPTYGIFYFLFCSTMWGLLITLLGCDSYFCMQRMAFLFFHITPRTTNPNSVHGYI